MSAARELQRQLKRLELCLPRPAKKPPAGPASFSSRIKFDLTARRAATGLMTRDEPRRIAANLAKLPKLLQH